MLLAGEVGKPHGLAGEVYVVVISDDPERFSPGANLHHADGRRLTVATSRSHGDRFLVTFEGITTREEATFLRGALYVPAEQARALDDDEFWHDELIGCTVVTSEGDEAGSVSAVIAGPAQDLLQLETARGQRFVPIVKEIVVRVDRDARQIVIDPPEGLLD